MLLKKLYPVSIFCLLALSIATAAAAKTLTIPGCGNSEYVAGELARTLNCQQKPHQSVIPLGRHGLNMALLRPDSWHRTQADGYQPQAAAHYNTLSHLLRAKMSVLHCQDTIR